MKRLSNCPFPVDKELLEPKVDMTPEEQESMYYCDIADAELESLCR